MDLQFQVSSSNAQSVFSNSPGVGFVLSNQRDGYKLLTLIIWLIQPMKEEILTYTPGTSLRPQPKPQLTKPVNS